MAAQPRHLGEEPVVGGLTQGEVEEHVVIRDARQALSKSAHVVGDQGGLALGPEWEPDVGGSQHVGGELAKRGADLGAEHRATGLPEHAHQWPGHGLGLFGQGVAHPADDAAGDRLDQPTPDWCGAFDPFGPTPRGGRDHATGQHRGLVEPVVSQTHGVGDRIGVCGRGGGVGLLGTRTTSNVGGQRPVDGAVVGLHHRLDLPHQARQVSARA